MSRHITTIRDYNDGYPSTKPGVLVVFRQRMYSNDGSYTYYVIFRPSVGSSSTFNCIDGATYRLWLRYHMQSYSVVEIYHGEVRFEFPFEQLYQTSMYYEPIYKRWDGTSWRRGNCGSVMGHAFQGTFREVLAGILSHSSFQDIKIHVERESFYVMAHESAVMALLIRESETFQKVVM